MERFIDDFTPIEVELVDEKGQVRTLKSQKTTLGKLRRLNEIDKQIKDGTIKGNQLDLMFEQIILYFGGKVEDYDDFTTKQIIDAVNHINKIIKNPPQLQEAK